MGQTYGQIDIKYTNEQTDIEIDGYANRYLDRPTTDVKVYTILSNLSFDEKSSVLVFQNRLHGWRLVLSR